MSSSEEFKILKERISEEAMYVLKNVTILSGFDDEEIQRIFQKCEIIEKKAGEFIIEEGSPASEIFIILQGLVGIVLDAKNNPVELAEFGPGNCIGEAAVIGVQKHSASVVAKQITELLVLTRTMIMEIYDRDKNAFSMLILNIARELARRLHHSDLVLLQYGKKKDAAKP